MNTVLEIESALKQLPLRDAQAVAQWLQKHLDSQNGVQTSLAKQPSLKLPDYAVRRRMIFGDKVLPNMVTLGREQERW